MKTSSTVLAMCTLLLATIVVYWPGLSGGYVFDDYPNIVENTALHVSTLQWKDWVAALLSAPASNLPRPIAMLSFALNIFFTGLDPVPMKVTNLVVHLANVLLTFMLTRLILQQLVNARESPPVSPDLVAVAITALWALNPINLMGVLFVVQRMESLANLFVLSGLVIYAMQRRSTISGTPVKAGRVLSSLLVFTIFGSLTKESAVVLPLYALCLEVCIFQFRAEAGRIEFRLRNGMFAIVAAAALVGIPWLAIQSFDPGAYANRDFTMGERLLTEPRVLIQYIVWILVPNIGELGLYHDDYVKSVSLLQPISTIIAIVVVTVLPMIAWTTRRRWPLASLGVFWFFSAHMLTATLLPLELVFEHRNYFASLGVILVLGQIFMSISASPRSRLLGLAVFCAMAFAFGGLTMLRAYEWRNAVIFAVSEANKHPLSPRATYSLGWILATATGYKATSPLIEPAFAALDRARALSNSNILPDQAALVLASRARLPLDPRWWNHMKVRLSLGPIGPQETGALAALVTCEINSLCAFPPDQMLQTFAAALSRGAHPEVLNIYANYALNSLGDSELALRLWREAKSANPAEPQYRIALIKVYISEGDFVAANQEIAELGHLGYAGQFEALTAKMRARMRAQATPSKVPPAP